MIKKQTNRKEMLSFYFICYIAKWEMNEFAFHQKITGTIVLCTYIFTKRKRKQLTFIQTYEHVPTHFV